MGSVCTSLVGEEAAQPIETAHEFAGKVAAHGPERGGVRVGRAMSHITSRRTKRPELSCDVNPWVAKSRFPPMGGSPRGLGELWDGNGAISSGS